MIAQRGSLIEPQFRDQSLSPAANTPAPGLSGEPREEPGATRGFAPVAPVTLDETGVSLNELINLTAKTLQTIGVATTSTMAQNFKFTYRVTALILEQMQQRLLIEAQGAEQVSVSAELRYRLTEKGKLVAREAQEITSYIGPAPVSLDLWTAQIQRQSIMQERVTPAMIKAATSSLVISDTFLRKIGPAANSGRSLLLYGPAGNGKTSVSEKIGQIFDAVVYIPYCVEIDGQYIRVFDPTLHRPVGERVEARSTMRSSLIDQRFVACKRPFVVVGGELTLAMLDMQFDPLSKVYEAPRHVKAINGVFLVDDFGRQQVSPEQMLNRWIVPLESRKEFLRLGSGKTVPVPFDQLVIFSTNLEPSDLMDPAFLRRIPYKLEIPTPTDEQFRIIFRRVAAAFGFGEVSDSILDHVNRRLGESGDGVLASFQPKFLLEQVLDSCRFLNQEPVLTTEMLEAALENLFVKSSAVERVRPGVSPSP